MEINRESVWKRERDKKILAEEIFRQRYKQRRRHKDRRIDRDK